MLTDNKVEVVVFELNNGRFVFGCYNEATEDGISVTSPLTVLEVMTQNGPQQVTAPYGHQFYGFEPTDKKSVFFKNNSILTGPFPAPEKIKDLWVQVTSVVKPVENKIEIVR